VTVHNGPTIAGGDGQQGDEAFYKQELAPFLAANPTAHVERRGTRHLILGAWNDDTVSILLRRDAARLFDALNHVYLPPRFTAVWHSDSRDFEVIWDVLPADEEIRNRKFAFRFRDRTHVCEFGEASERLLAIAEASRPIRGGSATSYRNLDSLSLFIRERDISTSAENPDEASDVERFPTSFWIHDIEWNDSVIGELTRHINFYSHYFDREAPRILIHDPERAGATSGVDVKQFLLDSFPETVIARPLEPYLLLLFDATLAETDMFVRFLYHYQIIEYAAFYYLQEDQRDSVRRVLTSPALSLQLNEAVAQILDVLAESRMQDDQRLSAVVRQLVSPELIWKEIEPNLEYFIKDVVFDGGFKQTPLLKAGCTYEQFEQAWPKFPDALRKMRNALVHSREPRMGGVIAPTRANRERLRPWDPPLSRIAMEVIAGRG
jgi:hypothetical protein